MFSRVERLFKGGGSVSSSTADVGQTITIDDYTVTVSNMIAEGGFGCVYLTEDEQGNKYALKKVRVLDQETLDVTTQEIEYLNKFPKHHNIVALYASDVRPSGKHMEVLMLLELCPGGHVVDIMNRRLTRPFDEKEVLKIFSDVCLAVTALHQHEPPIIHRDLKLENVLLSKNKGSFKLCDFGSATTQVLIPGKTHPIPVCEEIIQKYTTPNYRAPEMADMYNNIPLTYKTDVWALGCVLYKLMFFTDAFTESSLSVVSGKYKIPKDHGFSDEVLQLLADMFQAHPDQRPEAEQICERVFALRGIKCPLVRSRRATHSRLDTASPSSGSQGSPARSNSTKRTPQRSASVAGAASDRKSHPPAKPRDASPRNSANKVKTHRRNKSNPFETTRTRQHTRSPSNPFAAPPMDSNPFASLPATPVKEQGQPIPDPFAAAPAKSATPVSHDWAFQGAPQAASAQQQQAPTDPFAASTDSASLSLFSENPVAFASEDTVTPPQVDSKLPVTTAPIARKVPPPPPALKPSRRQSAKGPPPKPKPKPKSPPKNPFSVEDATDRVVLDDSTEIDLAVDMV
eukprot:m.39035 g.39035  ORF g.39035 m.39035 type:complete len:571 (-) comp12632_c0_seq1:70-1782(-)